jgi:hypothetical protein
MDLPRRRGEHVRILILDMTSPRNITITALAGGIGASKLLLGLYDVLPDPRVLTVIVNTGDDIVLHGLKISPDCDIVTYTLAGMIDTKKGWGFRRETFHALSLSAAPKGTACTSQSAECRMEANNCCRDSGFTGLSRW